MAAKAARYSQGTRVLPFILNFLKYVKYQLEFILANHLPL